MNSSATPEPRDWKAGSDRVDELADDLAGQIVSEENAMTIHAHGSRKSRVWMRPKAYRSTSPSES